MHLLRDNEGFEDRELKKLWDNDGDQVLAFMRGDLVFVFNFNPVKSFDGYGMLAPEGEYIDLFNSDQKAYGGFGNLEKNVNHLTEHDALYADAHLGWLKLYLPARTAVVLRKK